MNRLHARTEPGHRALCRGGALLAVRNADDVALVPHCAAQAHVGGVRDALRQRRGRFTGGDATARHADVNVDDDADFGAGVLGGLRDLLQSFDGVDRDLDVDAALSDRRDPRELVAADHLVRDQDVVAELGDNLCLADGRASKARARTGGDLPPRDLRRLVGLEVRANLALAIGEEAGHAPDVALHAGDIE